MILEEGFAWNGQTFFGSLSQIAKAMTGTNWNGHRFFGLRQGEDSRVNVEEARIPPLPSRLGNGVFFSPAKAWRLCVSGGPEALAKTFADVLNAISKDAATAIIKSIYSERDPRDIDLQAD